MDLEQFVTAQDMAARFAPETERRLWAASVGSGGGFRARCASGSKIGAP